MTSIPSTEPLWWARGNFVQITHIYQISTKYWGEFLRLISTAFKSKHPLRPTNYQRAICCWWRQLNRQGSQCCWWDIFFFDEIIIFGRDIFFLFWDTFFVAVVFSFLVRYFLFWWDIFLFCEIFSFLVSYCLCSDIFFFGEIFFGEILFDLTCLPSLSFSTKKKSNLQPTRASVPRIFI